jgi:MATE family multidrug resistance protein
VRLVLGRALLLALVLGTALVVLHRPILAPALAGLGGSDAVQETARLYVGVRIWSAPAVLANLAILGWLLGRQKVRLSLGLQVLINAANAVLILLFVPGFGWGVAGIAAATALADGIGAVAGLAVAAQAGMLRFSPEHLAALLDRTALLHLLRVNGDIFLRTSCLLLGWGLFARIGAGMGDVLLAANALLLNFQTFMAYGLDGFAHAAEALVGAAIGSRDRKALGAAIRVSTLWAGAAAALFSLAFLAFGPAIVRALTDLPEIRAAAGRYLPWAILSPLVSVWSFQLDGVFIGATRTAALRNGMAAALAGFCAAAWILVPAWGNDGLWTSLMLFMVFRAISLAVQLPGLFRLAER